MDADKASQMKIKYSKCKELNGLSPHIKRMWQGFFYPNKKCTVFFLDRNRDISFAKIILKTKGTLLNIK